jgi:hypothetical protein
MEKKPKFNSIIFYVLLFTLSFLLIGCSTTLEQTESNIEAGTDYNLLDLVKSTDSEMKISVAEDKIDINALGDYEVVFNLTDGAGKVTSETLKFTVIDTTPPEIDLRQSVEITINSEFSPNEFAKAIDNIDGDLTDEIEIILNTVDINKLGLYEVQYQVSDKQSNIATKTLNVRIVDKYSQADLSAIEVVNSLKSVLKNPDSLQLHSIKVGEISKSINKVEIDFSAQNGFGGMNRDTFYIEVNNGKVDLTQFDDSIQNIMSIVGLSTAYRTEKIDIEKISEKIN